MFGRPHAQRPGRRGQSNLPALAVALLVLTSTTVLGVVLADGAFASAQRDPGERRVAVALAERLVAADSSVTTRRNVLDPVQIRSLTPSTLDVRFPVASGYDVRIRLGDSVVVERGDPTGGETIQRVVLLEERQSRTVTLQGDTATLPRRSTDASITITPPPGTTVTAVHANDRVVLYDPAGLSGMYDVDLSRYETTTIAVAHSGPMPTGSVSVTYEPAQTTKSLLVVTVDA